LARAGLAVTVVERARFPRRKVCGEYLNSGALAVLEELGVLELARSQGSPLRGIRLVTAGAPTVELPFAGPALAIARERLDGLLLDAARAAGARVVWGRVEGLERDGARVTGVTVRDGAGETAVYAARYVAGADGIGSIVARKAGLTRPARGPRRFALGGHYTGFDGLGGHVEMYAGTGAYFALNPLPGGRANVMVVVREEQLAEWTGCVDEGLRGKAAALGRGHRSFEGAHRAGDRVSIGPLAHEVRSASAPGVVLVGDAAGFLNPFTGQGVYLALASARAAADALVQALAQERSPEPALVAYARERARDLAVRRRLAAAVGLLVDVPFLARRAASRLERRPGLGAVLMGALGGTKAPQSALVPGVLGRLVV
jgi:2-polyprenyl-6-methoxyphenol hydroxylase-like FAD-dependent oxidoreductase